MTKPYYKDNQITIYNKDSRRMPELADESIDGIITDPPYNVGKDFGNGAKADRRNDYIEWLWDIWTECGRVVKTGGLLVYTNRIVFIPQGMNPPKPWRYLHLMVWHKPLSLAGCWYGIAPHWEPIFIYVKGEKPWRPFRSELVQSDVISVNVATDRIGNHPTVKPELLVARLIEWAIPKNGLVLDPFLGSGTTLWVAKKLGRRAVGYEMNEEYCKLALERNGQMGLC